MISIIMPYWNRPELLKASLTRFEELYNNDVEKFEIIIVDDYSPAFPEEIFNLGLPIRSVMVRKEQRIPLNPCVPINHGVLFSRGDIILLTNPEILHRTPILFEMEERLNKLGPTGYVAAACWDNTQKIFICHTTKDMAKGRAPVPKNAGLHFCAMMYKSFFNDIGGFSEEYRFGQGYEDNDFLWKLYINNARFEIVDDLIVEHTRTNTLWPRGGAERNKIIFYNKWGKEIKNVN
jgi:glycosyltransferase involved in cell wall biosynthesis